MATGQDLKPELLRGLSIEPTQTVFLRKVDGQAQTINIQPLLNISVQIKGSAMKQDDQLNGPTVTPLLPDTNHVKSDDVRILSNDSIELCDEGQLFLVDPKSRTVRVYEDQTKLREISDVTIYWNHDDAKLFSTCVAVTTGFTKSFTTPLSHQKLNETADFVQGQTDAGSDFTEFFRTATYERPDKSVHEMVIERYWEKKEKLVKGKRRTGERCVQTRKIFSQWRLKTEHYFQEVEQVEISETIFRKNSLSDIDATIISQSEYFVDNLVGEIRYKQCTTGGQPCPLGGCTGPHDDNILGNLQRNLLEK